MTDAPLSLPDFILGGAPRAGTTWLYELLDRQPGIFMAKPPRPEPKFFLVDEIYEKGIEYYSKTWFSGAANAKLKGEKSANYLESGTVAERIAKHLPQVKLIFMLREPASRAYSNYLWSKHNQMETEDFETALALEARREKNTPKPLCFSRPHAYFSRGLYADLLRPYFELFGRDRILCLRYEDIREKPRSLAGQLSSFLKIRIDEKTAESLGKINAVPSQAPAPEKIRQKLLMLYTEPNQKLVRLLGSGFQLWNEKDYA